MVCAGLGWSKDNLRTADKCYVNGTYPNGTLMWPCGSSNHGEGTSGKFVSFFWMTFSGRRVCVCVYVWVRLRPVR